jgi:hypothetical protein
MNIKKWLARKGAVGSTSRWAAKGFHIYIKKNPNAQLSEVLNFLITTRYNNNANNYEKTLTSLVENDEVRGVAHLVVLILMAEAGYSDNDENSKSIFRDVIVEELESQNVPSKFIHQISF